MKVLHICLSAFFIDDRAYQENELVSEHLRQGHEVMVLASTQGHDALGRRSNGEPGDYFTQDGARVLRIPYVSWLPHKIARSVRVHPGVYRIIAAFQPDAIMFHGVNGWEILTVARYVRDHPDTIFYADNHTDFINSARTFTSKWLLHWGFYRPVLKRALRQIRKVLCITSLSMDFARDVYGVPDDKLELYPLGGDPLSDIDHKKYRTEMRAALGISANETVFLQSGKQSRAKALKASLEAFARVDNPTFRFLIAGVLMDDIADELEGLIAADDRVQFLGWKSPAELQSLLCAADVYVQPASQSATMQTSMCCHCAVIIANLASHEVFLDGNGWLLDRPSDIEDVLREISNGGANLDVMKSRSITIAREMLDYSVLAKRILS